jgi:cell division protein FtsB
MLFFIFHYYFEDGIYFEDKTKEKKNEVIKANYLNLLKYFLSVLFIFLLFFFMILNIKDQYERIKVILC